MSVEELRASIEQISVDIERQREVLKKLETNKSLLQRRLNAVLDPVARLPLEISSEIFFQCLPPLPERGTRFLPMIFLNICNSWSRIAISTPCFGLRSMSSARRALKNRWKSGFNARITDLFSSHSMEPSRPPSPPFFASAPSSSKISRYIMTRAIQIMLIL
ncbi:hypothetical protein DFH07DRAFT_772756 [Mycena maculata]|uniref:F-box domain-containing protein n=1 Tax=Mycena maculata TaxID=230809 RepID=A0AAD7J775_9AGAR|nr:hypothetical protein DFH07DRAFT_772756 [Mycena maculata]